MEGRKAKTAFELAMEKVAEMPKLNSEEIKEEHKKAYIVKGEAIAHHYLQNIHRKTNISNEISAFDSEHMVYARDAALECLSRELGLTNPEISRHILEGVAALNPNIQIDAALARLNQIIADYHKELLAAYSSLEKTEVKNLKIKGISGSAVKPNLKAHNSWHKEQAELTVSHTRKLRIFQKSLLLQK